MEIALDRRWDGDAAPPGRGGRVRLELRDCTLAWSWDLRLDPGARVPPVPPGFVDGLWEHDVVELFVGSAAGPGSRYVEIEVGPGGHWLALAFDGVRDRCALLREMALVPSGGPQSDGTWRGGVAIPLGILVNRAGPPPWRGLVAACVGAGPRVLLCTPPLPGDPADFHQPGRWMPLDLGERPDGPRKGASSRD